MLRQIVDSDVPYLSFSGGEPMVHPHFFEMVEYACSRGAQLKIETNGHYLTPENCARLKELGVKAVQVSLDGAHARPSTGCGCAAISTGRSRASANLRRAGVPIEINYSPTGFNAHEIGRAVDLAARARRRELLHRPHDVHRQRRQDLAEADPVGGAVRGAVRDPAARRPRNIDGRMRVHFHEMGLLDELRYRLHNPAALLIVLPNGLVKLINALPFVCGDLRKQIARRDLGATSSAPGRTRGSPTSSTRSPATPDTTSVLHKWVFL